MDINNNNVTENVLGEQQKGCSIQHPEESTNRINIHSKPVMTLQNNEDASRESVLTQQDDEVSQPVSPIEQEKQKLMAAEAIISSMIGKSIPIRMEIPTPSSVPSSTSVQRVAIAMSTTGSGSSESMCQIAAVHVDKVSYVYNRYITPKQENDKATEAQYYVVLNSGSTDSKTVITVAEGEAIKGLVDYLCDDDSKKILIAHEGEKFNFPLLLELVKRYNLMDSFKEVVLGLVDSMPLFKCLFPCRHKYRLLDLARDILGYNGITNNSEQEVSILSQLISHKAVFPRAILKTSLTLDYYLKCDEYDTNYTRNKSTYNMLVKTGVMTDYMAEKTASSGLGYDHLYIAYEAAGPEGLNVLVSLPWGGNGPRVTKNSKFIETIANYFAHLRKDLRPMRHPPWYKPCRFV